MPNKREPAPEYVATSGGATLFRCSVDESKVRWFFLAFKNSLDCMSWILSTSRWCNPMPMAGNENQLVRQIFWRCIDVMSLTKWEALYVLVSLSMLGTFRIQKLRSYAEHHFDRDPIRDSSMAFPVAQQHHYCFLRHLFQEDWQGIPSAQRLPFACHTGAQKTPQSEVLMRMTRTVLQVRSNRCTNVNWSIEQLIDDTSFSL